MSKDSYQVLLDAFNIKKDDLYQWGISSTSRLARVLFYAIRRNLPGDIDLYLKPC